MLLAEDYPLKRRHAGEESEEKGKREEAVVRMIEGIVKETESQVQKIHAGDG